jgi:hypothetical protein
MPGSSLWRAGSPTTALPGRAGADAHPVRVPNENVVVQYVDYLKNMVTGQWGIEATLASR